MTRDYPSKLPGVKLKHFFSMMPLVWEEEHACLCYEYDWTWSYIQRGETVQAPVGERSLVSCLVERFNMQRSSKGRNVGRF